MIAGLPPGRLRSPPLQGTHFFNPLKWEKVKNLWVEKWGRKGGREGEREGEGEGEGEGRGVRVWGSDRNEGAVAAARRNAERAGVEGLVGFSACGVGRSSWLLGEGGGGRGGGEGREGGEGGEGREEGGLLVAMNPPYGKRVSAKKDLLPLYQTVGERVKKLREREREEREGRKVGVVVVGNDVGLMRRMGVGLKGGFTSQHGGLTVTALVSKDD